MKKLGQTTYILSALLIAACGAPGDKQPVSDIKTIREKSDTGGKPTALPGAPREVPKYIEKEKEVIKEQATLNDSYIKVEVDKKDSPLTFFENRSTTAKIYLRILDPSIKMTLTAKDLPAGATLTNVSSEKEPNTYELKWTPPLYTIAFNEEAPKVMALTLVPVVDASKTPAAKVALVQKMFLEKVFTFSVFRTQEKPSELVVSGLSNRAEEGQVVPFSVVARIPGIDDKSPQKPTIGVFKDSITQVAGTDYREMDGVRYVTMDDSRSAVEYLGDFKWKFNLLLDTKNTPVEVQRAKDGSVMTGSDTTHARFAMKVYAPFTATNTTVVQVAIKRLPPPVVVPPPAPETPKTPEPAPADKSKPKTPAKPPVKAPAPKPQPKPKKAK